MDGNRKPLPFDKNPFYVSEFGRQLLLSLMENRQKFGAGLIFNLQPFRP